MTKIKRILKSFVIAVIITALCPVYPYSVLAVDWLGTWAHRRKITVSNTNIDSDLTHYPLLLTLGTSVGTGATDVSSIFDELTNDANRFKIAFTKTDGTTQLYAEIEKWDDANEIAIIWVSKSDLVLANAATTDIYIYYDSTKADNNTYIGDTNDEVAENVWDANHKLVYHLEDGASTSAVYDSTSNDVDGTKTGANTPLEVTGKIGQGQDFEINEIIDTSNNSILGANFTVESWAKLNSSANLAGIWGRGGKGNWMRMLQDNVIGYAYNDGSWKSLLTDITPAEGTWYYIVGRYDATDLKIYVNGVEEATVAEDSLGADARSFLVGEGGTAGIDGVLDEFRISDIARPVAWIKANQYNQADSLVAWSAEEESPVAERRRFIIFHNN